MSTINGIAAGARMRNNKLLKKAKSASKTLALQTRLLKSLRV